MKPETQGLNSVKTNLPESTDAPPVSNQPTQIPVISEPLTPSDLQSGLFLLTSAADTVEIAPGILGINPAAISKYPKGLVALAGDDYVKGSVDSEALSGNQGADSLFGQEGNDSLRGGQGADVLYGGIGNDLLHGNMGDDYLFGDENNDFIRGGQGNDALVGGSGEDTLIGDLGVDRLWGNEGKDVFVLSAKPNGSNFPPKAMHDGEHTAIPDSLAPVDSVQAIEADFILDYSQAQGDVIALTGGLTVNDVVLSQQEITYGDRRDYDSSGPFPLDQARTLDFQIETVSVTVITETKTGNILGLVKGVAPEQLTFVSVDDNFLAKG